MMRAVLDLRENFTVYDAAYVVLAQALEAQLVTADAKCSKLGGSASTCGFCGRPNSPSCGRNETGCRVTEAADYRCCRRHARVAGAEVARGLVDEAQLVPVGHVEVTQARSSIVVISLTCDDAFKASQPSKLTMPVRSRSPASPKTSIGASLAGKTFGRVQLDVSPRAHELQDTDTVPLPSSLAFANIGAPKIEIIDVQRHAAEKRHAMRKEPCLLCSQNYAEIATFRARDSALAEQSRLAYLAGTAHGRVAGAPTYRPWRNDQTPGRHLRGPGAPAVADQVASRRCSSTVPTTSASPA